MELLTDRGVLCCGFWVSCGYPSSSLPPLCFSLLSVFLFRPLSVSLTHYPPPLPLSLDLSLLLSLALPCPLFFSLSYALSLSLLFLFPSIALCLTPSPPLSVPFISSLLNALLLSSLNSVFSPLYSVFFFSIYPHTPFSSVVSKHSYFIANIASFHLVPQQQNRKTNLLFRGVLLLLLFLLWPSLHPALQFTWEWFVW